MTDYYHVYGAPGTGKTRHIVDTVIDLVNNQGVDPLDIGVYTFRTNAARVNRERLEGATGKNFPGSMTIHAQSRRLVAPHLDRRRVVHYNDKKDFASALNWPMPSSYQRMDGDWLPETVANPDYWGAYEAWMKRYPDRMLDDIHHLLPMPRRYSLDEFMSWIEDWEDWKEEKGLISFTDMPRYCLEEEILLDKTHLFFDEAQDMYPILYLVAQMWMATAEEVYLVGDPFQSIYGHEGARPEMFMESPGTPIVLGKTERLPLKIWRVGLRILDHVPAYFPPQHPINSVQATDRPCQVRRIQTGEVVDLVESLEGNGESIMVLARTNIFANRLASLLARAGVVFSSLRGDIHSWTSVARGLVDLYYSIRDDQLLSREQSKLLTGQVPECFVNYVDRVIKFRSPLTPEKLRSEAIHHRPLLEIWKEAVDRQPWVMREAIRKRVLKENRKIPTEGYITLGTIHSAKGDEADSVILLDEIPVTIHDAIKSNPDRRSDEARVFYVGATRSRKRLFVLSTPGKERFPLEVSA